MSIAARRLLRSMPKQFVAFSPGVVRPNGHYDPDMTNVGPRITGLAIHNGDITLTPGMVVSGLDIYGQVNGRGGTVRDCIIRGRGSSPTSQTPMAVGQSYDFGGAVFEWCRFDGTGREAMWTDCIAGGNYTMRYCDLTRGVDGVGFNNAGNATVECCRIMNGYYAAWWDDVANAVRTTTFTDVGGKTYNPPFQAQASGDTHSDGIQAQGRTGWVVRGCFVGGARASNAIVTKLDPTVAADYALIQQYNIDTDFRNACMMINANATYPLGLLVEKNWFQGGTSRLNLATVAGDTLSGVTVSDNRFIRSTWPGGAGYYVYISLNHTATLSNNVFDDDGTPVPVTTH